MSGKTSKQKSAAKNVAQTTGRNRLPMSMITIVAIIVVAIVAIWFISNQGTKNVSASYQRLNPQQYQSTMASGDHLLVDVRTAEEFRSGHIDGAVNIDLQSLPARVATLPKDKPIVLYCRSGSRSNSAAQILTRAGFTKIYDLGGIIDWRAQGLPLH
jgi:phage shock protein E